MQAPLSELCSGESTGRNDNRNRHGDSHMESPNSDERASTCHEKHTAVLPFCLWCLSFRASGSFYAFWWLTLVSVPFRHCGAGSEAESVTNDLTVTASALLARGGPEKR